MNSSSRKIGYPESARRLRENKEKIIQIYLQRARAECPAARDESGPALVDSIPKIIEELATQLENPLDKKADQQIQHMARVHGIQRTKLTDYNIEQVIGEYQIIREIVMDTIKSGSEIGFGELEVIFMVFDRGISNAAQSFADEKMREQLEERELRERFVSMLSHDLATPLTSIRVNAQSLARGRADDDPVFLATQRILKALARGDKMIRDLLDANRISAGESLPLNIEEVDLKELLSQTLNELRETHGDRFQLIDNSPNAAFVDPWALRRIVENLCTNAVKYGDPARLVTIKTSTAGETFHISVHNEGNPIVPEEVDSLFRIFQRAQHALASDKKGWGIGLTLVRGAVEAHGGCIGVESSKDKGTTFKVTLPIDARTMK